MDYILSTTVAMLQRFPVRFKKGCKLSSTGYICSSSERVQTPMCVCYGCCIYMAHKHCVNTFSPASTERFNLNHAILSWQNALTLFFHFYFNLFTQRPLLSFLAKFPFCLFTPKRKKKERISTSPSLSVMTFMFPTLSPPSTLVR